MNVYDVVVDVVKRYDDATYDSLTAIELWNDRFVELIKNVEVVVHLTLPDSKIKHVSVKDKQIKKAISIVIPKTIKVQIGKTNYEVTLSITGVIENNNSIKDVLITGKVFFRKGNKIWEVGQAVVHGNILSPQTYEKALTVLKKVAKKISQQ